MLLLTLLSAALGSWRNCRCFCARKVSHRHGTVQHRLLGHIAQHSSYMHFSPSLKPEKYCARNCAQTYLGKPHQGQKDAGNYTMWRSEVYCTNLGVCSMLFSNVTMAYSQPQGTPTLRNYTVTVIPLSLRWGYSNHCKASLHQALPCSPGQSVVQGLLIRPRVSENSSSTLHFGSMEVGT